MSDQEEPRQEPLQRFSELLELPKQQRIKAELRILEGLMAQAIRDKDWGGALKTFESAHTILSRAGRTT